MFVKDVDSREISRALRAMVLANDAEIGAGAGDPLELALLEYAKKRGVDVSAENERLNSIKLYFHLITMMPGNRNKKNEIYMRDRET